MYIKISLIQRLVDDVKFRERLASELGVTGQAIFLQAKKYIDTPFPDSNFTKIKAIKFFISEEYIQEHFLVEDISAI